MSADLRDPIHDALEGLRPDVERLALRPSPDVRRRGDARTRHQRAALVGVTAVTVAAVALGAGVLGAGRRSGQPVAPASGASASSATGSPSATASAPRATPSPTSATSASTTSPSTTASGPSAPPVVPMAPPGGAPAALFLPAALWAGPDLQSGHPTRFQDPFQAEGMMQNGTCDPDGSPKGTVALAQVRDEVTKAPLGQQKIRVHRDAASAATAFAALEKAMSDCQARLDAVPHNNVVVTVQRDTAASTSGPGGAVAYYRVQVATKDSGAGGVEWVALARQGSTVSTIMVNEPPATTAGFETIERVGALAAGHLALDATGGQ